MGNIIVRIEYKGVQFTDGGAFKGGYRVAVPINSDTTTRHGLAMFDEAIVTTRIDDIADGSEAVSAAVFDKVTQYIDSLNHLLPRNHKPHAFDGIWQQADERQEAPSMVFDVYVDGNADALRDDFAETLQAMAPDEVQDALHADSLNMGDVLRAWSPWVERVSHEPRFRALQNKHELSNVVLQKMIDDTRTV